MTTRRLRVTTLAIALVVILMPHVTFASWPFQTGASQNFPSAAVADINGDGVHEVVFASWDGYLYCTDAAGNLLWKLDIMGTSNPGSSPTLADVDGDPATLEVVIGSGAGKTWGKLNVVSSSGQVLAAFDTPSVVKSSPLVIDTDLDGIKEIYFGRSTYGNTYTGVYDSDVNFYALNVINSPTGTSLALRWADALPEYSGTSVAPAAADLLGDEGLEIVIGSSGITNISKPGAGNSIRCYDSAGQTQWEFLTRGANNLDSPTIADIDGDGALEVLQSSNDGYIYCLDGASGQLEWEFNTGGSIMHTQAVADLNQDGQLEIVVGNHLRIYGLNSSGQQLWTKEFTDTRSSYSSPSIGDLDGNGTLEIVFGTAGNPEDPYNPTFPRLYALDSTGQEIWAQDSPATIYSSPALADLDGNGTLEILFGNYAGQYQVLDKDGSQFQFDAQDNITDAAPWPSLHGNSSNIRTYGTRVEPAPPKEIDMDEDGFSVARGDCDDLDPAVHPMAPEICDGRDNNCNALVDEESDLDGDSFTICQGDCDDLSSAINPGMAEICRDTLDNDCNGLTDLEDPACEPVCIPSRKKEKGKFCHDGIDNDCDGLIDSVDPDCMKGKPTP